MAFLLRFGRYFPRYIRNLQSVNPLPAAAASNTFSCWNQRKLFYEHVRTVTYQVETKGKPRKLAVSQLTLDEHLQRLHERARRFGRLSQHDFDAAFQQMKREGNPTSSQSLMLLKCCGMLLSEELPQSRSKLVAELLSTLNSMDAQLDIGHYNALLKVYWDNEYRLNPIEFLSEMEKKNVIPNRVTYQRLIALYCQSGDLEGAQNVLQHMKENRMPINENVFSSLIIGHGRVRDLESARGILDTMRSMGVEPTTDTYAALTIAYAENGYIKAIQELFNELEENGSNLYNLDYLNLVYALAKNGHTQDVQLAIDKLETLTFGFVNDCIITIQKLVNINQHEVGFHVLKTINPQRSSTGQMGNVGTFFLRQLLQRNVAPEVLIDYSKQMKELNIHSFALSFVARLALRFGKFDYFCWILNELQKENFPIRQHYFWPLLLQCKTTNVSKVYEILRQMMDYKCPGSYATFSDYVYPVLFSEDSVIISDVIKKLKEVGHGLNDLTEILAPMVDYFVERRDLKQAADLVDEYNFVTNPSSLNLPLASSYIDTGDVTSTIKLLKHMNESASFDMRLRLRKDWIGLFLFQCVQFGWKRPEMLEHIMHAIKENNLSLSQETFRTINLKFCSALPNSTTELLKSITSELKISSRSSDNSSDYLRGMSVDDLEAHLIELKNNGMNTRAALLQLMLQHCRNKNIKRVKEIKVELDKNNFVYSAAVLAQLLDVHVFFGDFEESQQLFSQLKELQIDFDIDDYKILNYVALLIAKDHVDEAMKILNEWVPTDRNHQGHRRNHTNDEFLEQNVWRVLNACAEKGNVELTENIFKLILDKACIKVTNIMLGPIIKVYLQTDLDKAVDRFEELSNAYSCTPCGHELLTKLIEKGDHKTLQRIVDRSTETHGELNTLHLLAYSFIECGKVDDARRIFQTPGMRPRQDRLDSYCERLLNLGQLRQLEDLISVTSDLSNVDKDKLYLYLIRGYYQAKDPKKALDVWTLMQEKDVCPSDETLIFLAKVLKEFNEPVPFAVPTEQAIAPPMMQTRQPQPGNTLTPESALRLSQMATRVRFLLQDGNLDEALEMVNSLVDDKHHPVIGVFKSTLNELVKRGDIDQLKALEPKLNTTLRKHVSFNNLILRAHVCRGTHEEYISELETNVRDTTLCPAGGFIPLLEQHPELLDRVEHLAKEYTKYNYYRLLNSVWVYHFMQENYNAADKLFKETPSFAMTLNFRSILNRASNVQNVPMLERLLKVVKETKLPTTSFAPIYQEMMKIQCALQDTDGALDTLKKAKKDEVEYLIDEGVMQSLKTSLERNGQSMP